MCPTATVINMSQHFFFSYPIKKDFIIKFNTSKAKHIKQMHHLMDRLNTPVNHTGVRI